MDYLKYFFYGKNYLNKNDYGIDLSNEPNDKKIILSKKPLLEKLINNKINLKNIDKSKLKIIPLSLRYKIKLINNFINLYNENNEKKINFIKSSLSIRLKSNDKNIFLISFYTEFEDMKNIRPFNIFFIALSNDLNLYNKIAYIDIIGTKSHSDISFGNESSFLKNRFINIFKEKPLEIILNQNKINNLLNNKEYISKDSYERGFPEKKFDIVNPIYLNKKELTKIKLGNKCFDIKNNKLILNDCEKSKKFTYNNNKIIDNNKNCLSFHNNNNLTFVPCDLENKCNNDNIINNCNEFKIRKYGGIEIKNINKCLNKNLNLDECYKSDKVNFL